MSESDRSKNLKNYRDLLTKVDEKFEQIYEANSTQMKCGSGCYNCCAPDLSVFTVEAENIRLYLEEHSDAAARLQNPAERLNDPNHCALLSKNGQCLIYDVRPVICRSQGAPLQVSAATDSAANLKQIDACTLNFHGVDLTTFAHSDFKFDLDTLNAILSLIQKQYADATRKKPEQRTKLNTFIT